MPARGARGWIDGIYICSSRAGLCGYRERTGEVFVHDDWGGWGELMVAIATNFRPKSHNPPQPHAACRFGRLPNPSRRVAISASGVHMQARNTLARPAGQSRAFGLLPGLYAAEHEEDAPLSQTCGLRRARSYYCLYSSASRPPARVDCPSAHQPQSSECASSMAPCICSRAPGPTAAAPAGEPTAWLRLCFIIIDGHLTGSWPSPGTGPRA
jgi:hypothetical protein